MQFSRLNDLVSAYNEEETSTDTLNYESVEIHIVSVCARDIIYFNVNRMFNTC